jgi:hypothetical protein
VPVEAWLPPIVTVPVVIPRDVRRVKELESLSPTAQLYLRPGKEIPGLLPDSGDGAVGISNPDQTG